MKPSAALVLGALLSLGACSAESSSSGPDAPSSETAAGSSRSCEALTEAEIATLLARSSAQPRPANVGGLPACRWDVSDEVWVQVLSVQAETWAQQVPAILDQLRQSPVLNDPANRRKMEKAREVVRSRQADDPASACELFSLLLEIQGESSGENRAINLIPTKEDPKGISAQQCSRGTYTSVLLVTPDLSGSDDEITRAAAALDSAHERGSR